MLDLDDLFCERTNGLRFVSYLELLWLSVTGQATKQKLQTVV
jgi:hypothetical protein